MSCDAELQELMIQVDRMVEEKKLEWQDKIKNTESKLQTTLQENYNMRSIIDIKNNEIDSLRSKIKTRESFPMVTEYDQEMSQLRMELSQLKKSYEKYHYKYIKKANEIEKEKEDLYLEKIDLMKQINEYKNQQNNWNQERNKYKIQIEEIESKKNEAVNDCMLLTEQLKTMKLDLANQQESYSESEKTYANNLRELENKLQESQNCIQREITENRNKLSEIMLHTKRTMEEKQQVVIDNESAKRMIIRLETELGKAISDSKVKDKTICKYEHTIKMSEKAIFEKNEIIKVLQLNTSKDHTSSISKLENELMEARSSLKLSRKNEKSLQNELQNLDNKLKESNELIDSEQKNRRQIETNISQISKLKEDKSKLKNEIVHLESSIESIKSEMNDVKNQLQYYKSENDQLKQRCNQGNGHAGHGGDYVEKKDSTSRNDNSSNIRPELRTINLMEKERDDLLRFCEDKDMVIHRLQMENRILQEFITKLNVGLVDDATYVPVATRFEDYGSVSDVFNPLKETFLEYNDSNMSGFSKSVQQLSNLPCAQDSSNHSLSIKVNESPTTHNYYQSHEKLNNTPYRCTEDFLTLLSQKDNCIKRQNGNGDYLMVYPTLTAAKYFTEEREKTKQIEEIIDLHMTQLRLETDKKCPMNNQ